MGRPPPARLRPGVLWYSLVELPDARAQVERHALAGPDGVDEPAFLLSALLVQLGHVLKHLSLDERLPTV